MRRKRILAAVLAAALVVPVSLTGVGSVANAENGKQDRYYYEQLETDAKGIYDAMYEMYEKEIFMTGTQEYDLVANGHITSDQLAAYGGKQEAVLKVFGAARDAFYADYPDIFYVDFSNLSINVTEKTIAAPSVSENDTIVYGASLGTGRTDTYYVQGFGDQAQVEKAVGEHEKKIDAIVQGARNKSQSVREQVAYVNNAIIDNTVYKLDTNCSPGNSGHVRTSYGALVKGESLCEGYARAVKVVLDELGIRSVLVQGSYRAPDGSDNLHMWNYVQVDGKWYGLDATANDGMKGGADREKYLLAEKAVMEKNHIPDGIMSGAGFRFTYPQLAGVDTSDEGGPDSQEYKTIFEESEFLVQYRDGTESEGDVGIFKVSYKGMGYQEAVDRESVYMLTRFYQYMPATDTYKVGDWGYSDPKPFMMPQLKEALLIANGNSRYIEFAITKKEPVGPLYGTDLTAEELKRNWTFQGTESDFLVSTGKLDNPKGTFVPAPFARKLTPSNTGYLSMGKKHHITAVYNETLKEIDGQSAGYKLTVKDGWSAEENSKIENFKWDGDRTIEFDFTPSRMLADNYAGYIIQVTGLQGAESLKAPDSFRYDVKKRIAICAYRPEGIDLTLGGKPVLLEEGDLSYNDWQTEDGKKLTDVVDKIKLVATKPVLESEQPAKQGDQMLDEIKDQLEPGTTITESATFDIRLQHCNHYIIQTGNSVRLFIGFPEGFSPEQVGVTYKAYHFRTDENGKLVAEEISCVVTDVGLMITCDAFSPFAIVGVQDSTGAPPVAQRLLVMNSKGGEVTIENNNGDKICELTGKEDARTIAIKAKDGYSISKIYLSDIGEQKITDTKSMQLTLKYEDLAGCNNILDVTFAEEKQQEPTEPEKPKPEKPKPSKPSNPKPNKPTPDKPQQETSPTQKDPSTNTNPAGTQQQNNAASGSSGNSAGAASGSSKQSASDADKILAAQAPQEQAKAEDDQQTSVAASAASPAPSASSLSGKEDGEGSEGDTEPSSYDQGTETMTETGSESEEQLTAPGVEDDTAPESGDDGKAGEGSRMRDIFWTILLSMAGAGIIVGGIAVYVRIRRNWEE